MTRFNILYRLLSPVLVEYRIAHLTVCAFLCMCLCIAYTLAIQIGPKITHILIIIYVDVNKHMYTCVYI